ncbi:MAG TPA: glycosyltransferase family 2 protein [Elusimicrobiota bacterium]|nr:glycosyltransferase family 2 protein [Elusimicrobiota bacterium]
MSSPLTFTLIIPVLNELEAMKQILPRISRDWVDQVLVIDGGSVDGSADYARSLGYDVYVQKEKGLRAAYREGTELARGDVLITFSPDGNSLAEKIPPLVEKMKEGYDMVIVSRYKDDAHSDDDDLVTGFGNWMFTTLINLFFRARYTDAIVMFRAYRKQLIADLKMKEHIPFMEWGERTLGTLSGWEPQMSMRCAKARLKVCDIPGDEPRRISGQRKITPWRSGAIMSLQILYEFVRRS